MCVYFIKKNQSFVLQISQVPPKLMFNNFVIDIIDRYITDNTTRQF